MPDSDKMCVYVPAVGETEAVDPYFIDDLRARIFDDESEYGSYGNTSFTTGLVELREVVSLLQTKVDRGGENIQETAIRVAAIAMGIVVRAVNVKSIVVRAVNVKSTLTAGIPGVKWQDMPPVPKLKGKQREQAGSKRRPAKKR